MFQEDDLPGATHRYQTTRRATVAAGGYQIDFAVNSDLEFRPVVLKPYKLVLSVGHDEYWSWPMRDKIEAFIATGGNVAFFSGKTCFWQVRNILDRLIT